MQKIIRFSPYIGKEGPLFGLIHPDIMLKWGGALVIGVTIWQVGQSVGYNVNPIVLATIGFTICLSEWILAGRRPWSFYGKFRKAKRRVKASLRFNPQNDQLKPKAPVTRIKKKRFTPVENASSLGSYVEFRLRGQRIGAYLLQNGDDLRVTFAFRFLGFPASVSDDEALAICKKFDEGLKTLKISETVTFEAKTFSNCKDRVGKLQSLIDSDIAPEIKYLLAWEQKRARSLSRIHRHNPKSITVFHTYTIGAGDARAGDVFEEGYYKVRQLLAEIQKPFKKHVKHEFKTRVTKALQSAFSRGYQDAEEYLSDILGLPIEPIRAKDLWALDWSRYNSQPAPPIPSLLILSKNGLEVKGLGNPHPASKLFPCAPLEHKEYVYLQGKNKYVGICCLDAVPDSKPRDEWVATDGGDRLKQLFFGSSALNARKTYDTTITVQLCGQNQKDTLRNAEGLSKQGNRDINQAAESKRIDQQAEFKRAKALEASWALRDGGITAKVAVVAQIERDTIEELDIAVASFCNRPEYTPEFMQREIEYAHDIWWQCQPTSWGKIMKRPFDRRIEDVTPALIALLPLMIDQMPDTEGIEFLSQHGFTPVYQNPFGRHPHDHSVTVSKTGKGKSVKIIGKIVIALGMGGRVIVVDAGRADGSGSFDPLTKFVKGSYYNPLVDSYNPFEGADFRKISGYNNNGKEESARSIAQKTFKRFLCNAVRDLTLGDDPDKDKAFLYNKIITLLIDSFLNREDIQALYDNAFDDGFGSEAWLKMPTLVHFFNHLCIESLPENIRTDITASAIKDMQLSLSALMSRTIGQSISKPSSFRSDSMLTVVAMGGLSDNADAKPLSLCAAAFVLSASLASKYTLFVGDESSYLANFDAYMQIVASFFSGGRKMGVWCHLLMQSFDNLARSPHCADILDNTTSYFIGVVASSVKDFLKTRHIPEHLLKSNLALKTGKVKFSDALSEWTFSQPEEGNHSQIFYAPSFGLLTLAINGPEEVILRAEFEKNYPDKYECNKALAMYLMDKSSEALAELNYEDD